MGIFRKPATCHPAKPRKDIIMTTIDETAAD
jgi:hypothetical protein